MDERGTGEGDSEHWVWDAVCAPLEIMLTGCEVFKGGSGDWDVD